MKNNKGITLVALVITIVAMSIIVGISVTGGTDVLQKSKMTDYIGYMKLVKARADVELEEEFFGTNDVSISVTDPKGRYISVDDVKNIDITVEDKITGAEWDNTIFIKWNKNAIASQGIDKSILGEGDDEYFVVVFDTNKKQTVDVIYSPGCGFDGDRYYTLIDMENVITD